MKATLITIQVIACLMAVAVGILVYVSTKNASSAWMMAAVCGAIMLTAVALGRFAFDSEKNAVPNVPGADFHFTHARNAGTWIRFVVVTIMGPAGLGGTLWHAYLFTSEKDNTRIIAAGCFLGFAALTFLIGSRLKQRQSITGVDYL